MRRQFAGKQGQEMASGPFLPPQGNEVGQSLVEMTVGTVFLLLVVLILFEMAMVFRAYVTLINASREGAFYASAHPTMGSISGITCSSATASGTEAEVYVWITCQEALAAGLDTDPSAFQVLQPVTPEGTDPQKPIRVTVRYELTNPTQGIILPCLGRMGLATSFPLSATTEAPIRLNPD